MGVDELGVDKMEGRTRPKYRAPLRHTLFCCHGSRVAYALKGPCVGLG